MLKEKIDININTKIKILIMLSILITVIFSATNSGNCAVNIRNEKPPIRKLIIILSVGLISLSIKKSFGFSAITYPKNNDKYPIPITINVSIKEPTVLIIGSPTISLTK